MVVYYKGRITSVHEVFLKAQRKNGISFAYIGMKNTIMEGCILWQEF